VTALLAVTGCGTSQYLYVGNTADHVFFKVPAAWHKLSPGDIAAAQRNVLGGQNPAGQAGGPLIWSAAFDSAPNPSAAHIFSVTGTPVVYASVQQMNTVQRDRMSFDSMRDLLAPVTAQARKQAAAAGAKLSQFQSIGYQVLTRSGGVRGIGEQYQYTLGGTPEDFLQVVMTNSDTTKLYFFLIQCNLTCFTTYRNQIAAVVGSFTVRGS
jgi:hypothetical protein